MKPPTIKQRKRDKSMKEKVLSVKEESCLTLVGIFAVVNSYGTDSVVFTLYTLRYNRSVQRQNLSGTTLIYCHDKPYMVKLKRLVCVIKKIFYKIHVFQNLNFPKKITMVNS